jgi:uncharacterized OB-fold protein
VKDYVDLSQGPLPRLEEKEGAPFWEGTRRGEIRFPKCRSCGRFHWYPCQLCPFCHSSDIGWQAVTGQPKVWSWTCHKWNIGPIFALRGPYIVALVEFDDTPDVRLATNLVECKPEEVYIGMPLEALFQQVDDKLTMLFFRPMKDRPL